jgi:hypothetical protein
MQIFQVSEREFISIRRREALSCRSSETPLAPLHHPPSLPPPLHTATIHPSLPRLCESRSNFHFEHGLEGTERVGGGPRGLMRHAFRV